MSETKFTKGPWVACNMIGEDGNRLSPEEIGEYVTNAVLKRPDCSDFLFISAEKPSGACDVCHVGNGPDGPYNAHLIAAAPSMYRELETIEEELRWMIGQASEQGREDITDRVKSIQVVLAQARGEHE